eukprot:364709-Chlamydomonas_euryale.AAC.9
MVRRRMCKHKHVSRQPPWAGVSPPPPALAQFLLPRTAATGRAPKKPRAARQASQTMAPSPPFPSKGFTSSCSCSFFCSSIWNLSAASRLPPAPSPTCGRPATMVDVPLVPAAPARLAAAPLAAGIPASTVSTALPDAVLALGSGCSINGARVRRGEPRLWWRVGDGQACTVDSTKECTRVHMHGCMRCMHTATRLRMHAGTHACMYAWMHAWVDSPCVLHAGAEWRQQHGACMAQHGSVQRRKEQAAGPHERASWICNVWNRAGTLLTLACADASALALPVSFLTPSAAGASASSPSVSTGFVLMRYFCKWLLMW